MANWFAYDNQGSPLLAGSYTRVFVKPTCISGGPIVCAIYLNDNSTSSPSFIDGNVLGYISNTMVSMVAQPADGSKPFVYVRSCF